MIFVTLGTQDKQFMRLLNAVETLETEEQIIIQAGCTDFETDRNNIEVYKFLDPDEFNSYMKRADQIITHAGVGTIVQGLKLHKKIIVAARLKEYKEHVNNHQEQILETFSDIGYILPLYDFDDLSELVKKEFIPKDFVSNNKNFVKNLNIEIEKLTGKGEK